MPTKITATFNDGDESTVRTLTLPYDVSDRVGELIGLGLLAEIDSPLVLQDLAALDIEVHRDGGDPCSPEATQQPELHGGLPATPGRWVVRTSLAELGLTCSIVDVRMYGNELMAFALPDIPEGLESYDWVGPLHVADWSPLDAAQAQARVDRDSTQTLTADVPIVLLGTSSGPSQTLNVPSDEINVGDSVEVIDRDDDDLRA